MNTTNFYFALALSLLIVACSNNSNKPSNLDDLYAPQNTVVCGKILNHNSNQNNNSIDLFLKDLVDSHDNSHSEGIEEDGTFRIEFDKSFPGDIYFRYQRILSLYVDPGDSIYIEIDAGKFLATEEEYEVKEGSIIFGGDNSKINTEIWLFQTEINKYYIPGDISKNERELEEADFLAYMQNVRAKNYSVLDSLTKSDDLSEKFIQWASFGIDYEFSTRLLHYIWYYPQVNSRRGEKDIRLEVSDTFYAAINSVELDNRNAIVCANYRDFLLEHNMNSIFDSSTIRRRIKLSGGQFVEGDEFAGEYRKFVQYADDLYEGFAKDIVVSQRLYDLVYGFRRLDVFETLYPEFKDKLHKDFVDCLDAKYELLKTPEEDQGMNP